MDNVSEKLETYLKLRYPPVKGLHLDEAIKELKHISKTLGSFGLIHMTSRDTDAVRRILAIIDGIEVPQKILIDGEA
jgi:hypothetical protein|tara:strand:+ start:2092 stop:2322 length:231 start_codon:yes stop_codon:yes gene_type:complete